MNRFGACSLIESFGGWGVGYVLGCQVGCPEADAEFTGRSVTMVQIAPENDVVTLINVFTVSPDQQQRLVDLLVEATQTTMRHVPGSSQRAYTRARTGHAW